MTSMLKPVLALCLVGCFSFSSAQETQTSPNLINNQNWSGAVYGADPGGCCASISGSGALYDTTTDTIMFSYGTSTLSQTIGLNQALGGTGLQVQGYNYSWEFRYMLNNTTKNDTLTFNVSLLGASGNVLESHLYNYDALLNSGLFPYDTWSSASSTVTYQNPYTDPQSISLSITGKDGGFWAGYYGPEVRNVSLSVNYSVDPCAADPLYSTSCAGYWEAFQERYPTPVSEPEVTVVADSTAGNPAPEPVVNQSSPVSETATQESTAPAPESTATPVAESSVAAESESRREAPANLSQILSNIRGIESELQSITQNTVNQSISGSQEAAEASAVASQAATDSSGDAVSMSGSAPGTEDSGQVMDINVAGGFNPLASHEASVQASGQPQVGFSVSSLLNLPTTAATAPSTGNTATAVSESVQLFVSDSAMLGLSVDATDSTVMDTTVVLPGDAVGEARQGQTHTASSRESPQPQGPVVRDTAPPAELQGGASIAALAAVPAGFDAYVTNQLVDTPFYAPRDIYAGQRTVDNVRALRQLSSDRLHREMVDQQYRSQ